MLPVHPHRLLLLIATSGVLVLGCGRSAVYGHGTGTGSDSSAGSTSASAGASSGTAANSGGSGTNGGSTGTPGIGTSSAGQGSGTAGTSGTSSAGMGGSGTNSGSSGGETGGSSAGANGSTSGTTSAGCASNRECPLLFQTCQFGSCQDDFCGPVGAGSPSNGALDGFCSASDAGDGACVPSTVSGSNVGLCFQGGGSPGPCDPEGTRADLERACGAGAYCLSLSDGGRCFALCDPFSTLDTCASGTCQAPLPSNPRLGLCEPETSTGTSTGTSGLTTGGGTTGGGSTGSGGSGGTTGSVDGGCGSTPPVEFSSCQVDGDCGCPLICAQDSAIDGSVCEYPCTQLSDCPNLSTSCGAAGACAVVQCGGATGNGVFDGLCTVVNANDGTCLPLTPNGSSSIGFCELGGTTSSNCDPNADRTDQAQACPAGQLCFGGAFNFGGTCNPLCDPAGSGTCPPGQACSSIINEPDLGVCL